MFSDILLRMVSLQMGQVLLIKLNQVTVLTTTILCRKEANTKMDHRSEKRN